MDGVSFINLCIDKVNEWYKEDANPYVVWACKTLQNNKCLLSTPISDHRYFEFTYNGNNHELYMDIYVKEDNWIYQNEK